MDALNQWNELKEKFREICGLLSMEEILSNVELMERIIRIEAVLNLQPNQFVTMKEY